MKIEENVALVRNRIEKAARAVGRSPDEITLVAATKTNSSHLVAEAIKAGISVCGENRVQELVEKNTQGAYIGASLHFIGHLQKNKVKQLVGVCDLIQSVDSLELLEAIDSRAKALGRRQDVLIEINIGGEASKSGIDKSELTKILEKAENLSSVFIRGLMAIPPISGSESENRACFARMRQLFIDNSAKKYDNVSMDFLSMGMSGDFEDAIAEGSNMVRVGSAIFGVRVYPPKAD
ncbi:MAG: YggS family pyridoxal phosphate-dependent enzyme [Firmicutes bacterium HGW-Firmicutes-16]|nr:MAG: YggS family pyridoxal phosphate-dependent enzyme [Firmicutes bacterium HGW-Firmicutes-16]